MYVCQDLFRTSTWLCMVSTKEYSTSLVLFIVLYKVVHEYFWSLCGRSQRMLIQKWQYFPVVLFVPCACWLYLLSLLVKSLSLTIKRKATEKYFPMMLLFMPWKLVLTFDSVCEIYKFDNSNTSYEAGHSCFAVY